MALTQGSELYFPLKAKGILEDFSRSADRGTMYKNDQPKWSHWNNLLLICLPTFPSVCKPERLKTNSPGKSAYKLLLQLLHYTKAEKFLPV